MSVNLEYTNIKAGVFFKQNGERFETIDSTFSKKSRQKGTNQIKAKNLSTGNVVTKTLKASDKLEDLEIEKEYYIFIYKRNEEAFLHKENEPSNRVKCSY